MVGLLVGVLLATPASAQDDPPGVAIEVSNRNPAVTADVVITVRVFDPDDPSRPIDPTQPDDLIEFRPPDSTKPAIRPVMTHIGEGTYRTEFAFLEEGTWQVVALPDTTDRSLIPPASTLRVTIEVRGETQGSTNSTNGMGTAALLILIAGGVIVMLLAGNWLRRPKGAPKAKPMEHDSWWFSP